MTIVESREVKVGGVYQHTKTKGIYRVIGVCDTTQEVANRDKWDDVIKVTHTEEYKDIVVYLVKGRFFAQNEGDSEPLVLYHNVSSPSIPTIIWARPKSMFEDAILLDLDVVPRFKLLS